MPPKKLTVGDPAYVHGRELEITGLEERDTADGTRTVAIIEDTDGLAVRAEAREKILELRAEQAALADELPPKHSSEWNRAKMEHDLAHDDLAKKIDELSTEAMEVYAKLGLRADLLDWWEERGVWVSDGRILSDNQIEAFREAKGRKPAVHEQRDALTFLDAQEG